ncbi:MAG TPA: sigma factor-like helix-turn-helix DNA-binding protein [Thermoanaerobaculia bacterium]
MSTALDRMPDEMRRCFLLRFAQGFEEGEVAMLMKIPVETVREHLREVRQRLSLECL